jgi:DNA-binding CsgD family transcriptional regulator
MTEVLDELKLLQQIRQLIAVMVTDGKGRKEQVLMLARAGMAPKEIADILSTTPNTVSVMIHQAKGESRNVRTRKPSTKKQ